MSGISLPWVEKYRPNKLDDIIGNKDIIAQFKNIVKSGNVPHMILCGSPGTGKTTSVLCLANELLGNNFVEAFLELNASDERKIEVIRDRVKEFCKKKVNLAEGRHKIIFLDEADSMTITSQQALRRIIENYTHNTRFIMACNSSNTIIEAIQSRCVINRFMKLNNEDIAIQLKKICANENIKYEQDSIEELVFYARGDLRRAINDLQSVYNTFGDITVSTITQAMNRPSRILIERVLNESLSGNFKAARITINELLSGGFDAADIVSAMFQVATEYDENEIKESTLIKILKELGETQMNITKGGDPQIQLYSLIAKLV